jgi:hypothetical protein
MRTAELTESALKLNINPYSEVQLLLFLFEPMRPKARGLAQHGGSLGWLEGSDPAGVILYVMDWP